MERGFCGLATRLCGLAGGSWSETCWRGHAKRGLRGVQRVARAQKILARDMAILEGLVLRNVQPGRYELCALPLALEGFDGSPVRAALRTIE